MDRRRQNDIREAVRQFYGRAGQRPARDSCPGADPGRPAGTCPATSLESYVRSGYPAAKVKLFFGEQEIGLCAGNPLPAARLKKGETALDLGCGKGLDAFLAAQAVGDKGRVIGVDMTPDVLAQARKNLTRLKVKQVEFRLGEIEHVPVADASVDVIISNCALNLSPDKLRVFREAFRVLRPGGRMAVADIIAARKIPEKIRRDETLYCTCIGGAATTAELRTALKKAGFTGVRITPHKESCAFIREWAPLAGAEDYVVSATIAAVKR